MNHSTVPAYEMLAQDIKAHGIAAVFGLAAARGCVSLLLPTNVQFGNVARTDPIAAVPDKAAPRPQARASAIAATANMLQHCRKPLFVVGAGAYLFTNQVPLQPFPAAVSQSPQLPGPAAQAPFRPPPGSAARLAKPP